MNKDLINLARGMLEFSKTTNAVIQSSKSISTWVNHATVQHYINGLTKPFKMLVDLQMEQYNKIASCTPITPEFNEEYLNHCDDEEELFDKINAFIAHLLIRVNAEFGTSFLEPSKMIGVYYESTMKLFQPSLDEFKKSIKYNSILDGLIHPMQHLLKMPLLLKEWKKFNHPKVHSQEIQQLEDELKQYAENADKSTALFHSICTHVLEETFIHRLHELCLILSKSLQKRKGEPSTGIVKAGLVIGGKAIKNSNQFIEALNTIINNDAETVGNKINNVCDLLLKVINKLSKRLTLLHPSHTLVETKSAMEDLINKINTDIKNIAVIDPLFAGCSLTLEPVKIFALIGMEQLTNKLHHNIMSTQIERVPYY
ncbi:hypothetical protein Lgra_2380 [Legionella gratiana]|uniref:Uncharacterized protein n=1 Tax=Legionella gratiana TaxID=45066 RepID=A0A378JF75_9GAMM|nr:hypothetical protein [Legionella gratiana]KTD09145.1 hypothetical protein Lgra_2380 [Legionella gratiana]STX45641.1 Uncharacterised protein [Legionella gratiana]